ncbi:hypothetical protein QTH91_20805 [Variovorax dokdonensis]|uniref:Uncharacterized protein n=1 Tax=Variovorax dokdonensis TaxID=344883 RepID=A0ABT7NG63_9BURK|nr:hypothetical protein [Variovorax dokdonensis]MDM0046944.1 hypothetical protein [Variovorax dokdonensis]
MPEPMRRSSHRYRTWPATLAIAALLLVYVGGLRWWDARVPGARNLSPGETVAVGHVRFVPASGWQMDVARSRPGQSIVLFKGGATFAVRSSRWLGDQTGPLSRQQRLMERVERVRMDGDVMDFHNAWGLRGVSFAYYGANATGRFWQAVDTGRKSVVQVDFYGPHEGQADAMAQAREMVDSMDLEAS